MQTIRIIISDRTVQSVEVKKASRRKLKKNVPALLRTMPKPLLAKALAISPAKEESANV